MLKRRVEKGEPVRRLEKEGARVGQVTCDGGRFVVSKTTMVSIHGGRPADGTRRPASVTTYERDKDENCDAHAGIVHTAY